MSNIKDLSFDELSLLESLAGLVRSEVSTSGKKVLSPIEWASSPYYSGDLSKFLYPFWKEEMPDIFVGEETKYDEIVVTGGIGTGKTYFCCAVWMYMAYLLSLLRSPQETLGLSSKSFIYFVYLSVKITTAMETGFGELTQLFDTAPYFCKDFPRDKNISTTLRFPKNIQFVCGSDVSHFIGKNMLSLFYDETNFAKTAGGNMGDIKKAKNIYSNSRTRIKSRFENERIKHFVLNMLVSSSTHAGSFTEEIIRKADDRTKIILAPIYKVKPKGTYKETNFLFFSGTEFHEPKVIDGKGDLKNIISDKELTEIGEFGSPDELFSLLPNSEKFNFHLLPTNFERDARQIPKQVVQDVIGLSLATTDKLFKDGKAYERMCLRGKEFGLRHPFSVDSVTLSRRDSRQLIEYLDVKYLKELVGSNYCFLHIDQAESKCNAGISLVFPIRFEGEPENTFVIALMMKIFPPQEDGDKISLDKIRQFVEDLRDIVGLNIGLVTFDQFQSSMNIEILEGKSFKTGNLSVDRSDEVYVEMTNIISRNRVIAYDYAPFKTELFQLIQDREKKKVIKPDKGSKDISDSVIGSLYDCFMTTEPQPDFKRQDLIMKEVMIQVVKQNEEDDLNKKLFGESYQVFDGTMRQNIPSQRDINPWRKKQ